MYNLIFYYIYRQQINKGKSRLSARYNGSIIVLIALSFHIGVFLAIIRKYFLTEEVAKNSLLRNKGLLTAFALGLIFLIYLYFTNNRIEKIENKYSESQFFHKYGGLLTAILIFIPMLIFIIVLS